VIAKLPRTKTHAARRRCRESRTNVHPSIPHSPRATVTQTVPYTERAHHAAHTEHSSVIKPKPAATVLTTAIPPTPIHYSNATGVKVSQSRGSCQTLYIRSCTAACTSAAGASCPTAKAAARTPPAALPPLRPALHCTLPCMSSRMRA